jgi:opacity protein-like surface antigen
LGKLKSAGDRDGCLCANKDEPMTLSYKAGLATAALAVAAFAPTAIAGDMNHGGGRGGSVKDRGQVYEPAPMQHLSRGAAGNCYFRGDLGYSVSRDPSVKWAVTNSAGSFNSAAATAAGATGTYDPVTNVYTAGAGDPVGFDPTAFYSVTNTYVGDTVSQTSMENAWFGGVGIGCGSGSRGLRGEVMLGYTGHRKIDGQPLIYQGPAPALGVAPAPVLDDPLHAGVKSYTAMFNGYYDLGNWGGITPYIGAGVGMSHNTMSEVYFTDNVNLPNKIQGDSRLSLAWSLNAGFGWQVSDRAILDFGYRYMNYGKANSGIIDSAGFVNPMVRVDDLAAHEFKVGLRYHFGAGEAPQAYQPMK